MVQRTFPSGRMMSAVVLGAALLVSGCSEGSTNPKPLPEEPGVAATTASPTQVEHREALFTYRAMWGDLAHASHTADASSKRLDDHAEGGAVELMKYGLRRSKKAEMVSKGTPRPHPEVASAKDGKVVIRDCVDGTHWLNYKRNGEPEDDKPGSHFKADATVEGRDGAWKVSSLYMHEAGSC